MVIIRRIKNVKILKKLWKPFNNRNFYINLANNSLLKIFYYCIYNKYKDKENKLEKILFQKYKLKV